MMVTQPDTEIAIRMDNRTLELHEAPDMVVAETDLSRIAASVGRGRREPGKKARAPSTFGAVPKCTSTTGAMPQADATALCLGACEKPPGRRGRLLHLTA